jgi:uncharacterized protein (UPF0276 family)
MNNDDSYTIMFTNEMLKSIGIDTNSDDIEVEITIENGSIKVCRKEDAI